MSERDEPARAPQPPASDVAPGAQLTVFAADLADPRARAAAVRAAPKGGAAKRTAETSDVTRVRRMAIAAVFAALGVGGALALTPTSSGLHAAGPGPLSGPHQGAKLTCAACHGDADPSSAPFLSNAKAACVKCHAPHGSTRTAHAKLLASGELRCTSCHAPHGPHQGARFTKDGAAFRYGQGASVPVEVAFRSHRDLVVPLIPLDACAACHAVDDPKDPIARCARGGRGPNRLSLCLDEHQEALPADATDVAGPRASATPLSSKGVCAAQHFADRPLAWEAARVASASVPWVKADVDTAPLLPVALAGLSTSALGYAGAALFDRLRRRKKTRVAAQAPERKRLPVIRTNTCLGCYACVDACPYGVLEVEKYVAVVARPDACCGLVLCEQKCPNGSLQMSDGEIDLDRPRLQPSLESVDQPGLFLAGDITGLPLIKNAILQGHHAADAALDLVKKSPASDDVFDLCVVGAGPSGISAALRAKERGAAFVVVEQGNVAESIRSFPRGKLVFDQPLDLPLAGKLWLRESTKEELLMHWMRIVRREELPIREGRRMTRLEKRADGTFELRTARTDKPEGRDEVLRARTVILAIGQRGTPRRLACVVPPEAESRVHYHLADARSFEGRRVLVVGLGDTAMESAIALAHQRAAGGEVIVAHRAATFTRGQRRNIDEVERLRKAGAIDLRFGVEIAAVDVANDGLDVSLVDATSRAPGGRVHVDAVLVLIGNISPGSTLAALGVKTVGAARAKPPA
ncbi:MAG: NAD(P)-binding domain-containing protein [Polyangiaceae bacterium]